MVERKSGGRNEDKKIETFFLPAHALKTDINHCRCKSRGQSYYSFSCQLLKMYVAGLNEKNLKRKHPDE